MPTNDVVDAAVKLLNRTANYQYFFEVLDSPDWIDPLFERGFFQHPPAPIPDGEYLMIPVWVESRYLVRVTDQAPRRVAQILKALPSTDNTRVHEDIVDAVLKMPPELASTFATTIVGFLDSAYHSLLPEKVRDYIRRMVESGFVDAAETVARSLLEPVSTGERVIGDSSFPPELRPKFSFPEYGEVLHDLMSAISVESGELAFRLVVDLLDDSLEAVFGESRDDYSYIWCPSIEAADRFSRHREVLSALVAAASDSQFWQGLHFRQHIATLKSLHWPVFRRLELHAIRMNSHSSRDLVDRCLDDLAGLFDPSTYHEFVLLLRDVIAGMAEDESLALLEAIEAASRVAFESDPDSEDRRSYWVCRTLAVMKPGLPPTGLQRLDDLQERLGVTFGRLSDPSVLIGPAGDGWVGQISPKTSDELVALGDDELILFLSDWKSSGEWRSPSADGLGDVLRECVIESPDRFSQLAHRFIGLEVTYVRSIIDGLRHAVGTESTIEWSPVLELCSWAIKQTDEFEHQRLGREPEWSWVRLAVGGLLHDGLTKSKAAVPQSERGRVWRIISVLVEDVDPDLAGEKQYGVSQMGPVNVSLNTVRGQAFHALVRYVLWVRLATGESSGREVAELSEVRSVLDRHLEISIDPSPAIRSVYGQFYPWLHLVDPEWAESVLLKVFPIEPSSAQMFASAWDAYVVFTQPFDDMAEVMRPVYGHAVTSVSSRSESAERLAEHLAVFVCRGVLRLEDQLINEFFEVSPALLRGHVHEFLGRGCRDVPVSDDRVKRSMALWDARLAKCIESEADETEEIVAFGWWFSANAIDPEWRLNNLLVVLGETAGRIDFISGVLEELAAMSDRWRPQTLAAVRTIVRGVSNEGWELIAGRDHIMAVLSSGLQADAGTRSSAIDLIHELGAAGFRDFRSVLDSSL